MARDICVAVGKMIRALRKARGWRQIDLAAHSGINENYLSHLELGKKEVCLRNLEVLAQTFERSLSELLKGL
jgi:transcriptional regulator with XRE-family HTH domain